MWIFSSPVAPKHRINRARSHGFRFEVEALEDRCCPTGPAFEWADPTGGALDPTFGSGGQVLSSFTNLVDEAQAVTTQADGKIVVAGVTVASGSRTGNDFLVARYNADGTVDTSFGSGGHMATDFKGNLDWAFTVGLQPQTNGPSKILVAGRVVSKVTASGVIDDFGLARYNANGTLDTTFGSKGKVITDLGGANEAAQAVLADSSGRTVVAGFTTGPGGFVAALVRYNANGSLDTSFGNGGKLVTNISLANQHRLDSMVLQPDGKIVIAGTMIDPATSAREFVVARFNTDGTTDTTFGSGGTVITQPGSVGGFGGVGIQGDGKIVVGGSAGSYNASTYNLLRLNADGTPDAGFGTNGLAAIPGPATDVTIDARGVGLAIQADGKIMAGGQYTDTAANNTRLAVLRVNSDSSMDVGFGTGGWATIQFGYNDSVEAMAMQPDGRVLLAGYARPTSNTYPTDVALVRFLASAPQIGSFTADLNPVPSGSTTTLSASNIVDDNPGATVAQVAFYIMINDSPLLLGYGTQNSDGSWSYAFDTTGYAPDTYTLYAQATDSYGVLGNPVAMTLTVL